MTDYWVSTKKHFCSVCKCWISSQVKNIKRHELSIRHISTLRNKMIESHKKKVEEKKQDKFVAEEMKRLNSITLDNPIPADGSPSLPYVNSMFSYGPLVNPSVDVETEKKRIMNTISRNLAGLEPPEHVDLKYDKSKWTASIDQDDGTLVYYNKVTGVRTKKKPADFDGVMPTSSAHLTSNWVLKFDPNKRSRYYHNTSTGEIRWLDKEPIVPAMTLPQEVAVSARKPAKSSPKGSPKSEPKSEIMINLIRDYNLNDTNSIKIKYSIDEVDTKNDKKDVKKEEHYNNKPKNKLKDYKDAVYNSQSYESNVPLIGQWEEVDPKDSVFSHCVENMDNFLETQGPDRPDVFGEWNSFKPNKRLFKNIDDPEEVSKPVYKKNSNKVTSDDEEPETIQFKKRKVPKRVHTTHLL